MSATVVSASSVTSQSVTHCKNCCLTVEKQIRYYKRSLADKEAALAKAYSLVKRKDREIAMLNKKISQQEHTIKEELRYIKKAAQRGRYLSGRALPGDRNPPPPGHGLSHNRISESSDITSNTDWTDPDENEEEDDDDATISPSGIYKIREHDAKPPPPKPTLPTDEDDDEDSDEDDDVFEDSAFGDDCAQNEPTEYCAGRARLG